MHALKLLLDSACVCKFTCSRRDNVTTVSLSVVDVSKRQIPAVDPHMYVERLCAYS